ncbi:MAG: serine/threonine-protein kinase [Halioglobus sp.]
MTVSASIGPYQVLRLINQGGQGSVYLGYDSRLQRRVAIKVHPLPEDKTGRDHILDEAQIVAAIQSNKVVQIYDVITGQRNMALVMEYVPGCDLEEFLSHGRPSLPAILTIATDIAGALTAARQQQIVHGDVKARNVLITEDGRAKLTDFGIARAAKDGKAPVITAGSPSCISPEQYLGLTMDVRSDLFALGCLLYRMLSGEQPFLRNGRLDPAALLEQMPADLKIVDSSLPNGLCELVQSLLQKKPEDRPRDTLQVRFALRTQTRSMSPSTSGALRRESQAYYRAEAPGDVPPPIPTDLKRAQTLRFGRMGINGKRLLQTVSTSGKFFSAVIFATAMFVLFMLIQPLRLPDPRVIQVYEPDMRIPLGMDLPGVVSPHWLVEQVIHGASTKLGSVHVLGPVGGSPQRTLYANPRERTASETLTLALRCSGELCFLAMTRELQGERNSQYAILLPEMSQLHWESAIHGAARLLYN